MEAAAAAAAAPNVHRRASNKTIEMVLMVLYRAMATEKSERERKRETHRASANIIQSYNKVCSTVCLLAISLCTV